MPSESREAMSRAVLEYVCQMLVELARMSEDTGRSQLAERIRGVAAEAALESLDVTLGSPGRQAEDPHDPQD